MPEGEYWTVAYAGQVVRLRDTVGLRHLSQLLWHPYREFHVLALMQALAASGRSCAGRPPNRATSPLDAIGAAAYRRRIVELDDDLADAHELNDLGRIDLLRAEYDVLVHELRAGARARRLHAEAERARTAVSKALASTLRRIRTVHETLGAHLDVAMKRGYVCVYRPDPRLPIEWEC